MEMQRMKEILPGCYTGGIKHYRVQLEAGAVYEPETYPDKIVLLVFGKGRGYITDTKDAYNVEELSFYFPEFDRTPYKVHAITDLEFIMHVIKLNEWDQKLYDHTRDRLPLFRVFSKCSRIDEEFQTENTVSRDVLGPHQLGRIAVGGVCAQDGGGTKMTCDPYATQWFYFYGRTDCELIIEGTKRQIKAGEFVMIRPGEKYSVLAEKSADVCYVWLKHFTRERDFKINPMPTHFNH